MSDSIIRIPGGAQQEDAPRGTPKSNEVTLIFNGKIWSGWTAIRIGRGVERFPSDFEFALTERYPGEAGILMAEPGTACVVKIGDDVVITGFIDRYVPAITPHGHEVRIHGRSRCCDLVDCAAGVSVGDEMTTQIQSSSVIGIVRQLCKPFDITVSTTAAEAANQIVPKFNVNLGETSAEIIDRVCRYAGLLYYDDVHGNLVLAQVGEVKAASGFEEGVNIEAAGCTFSMDQRFSEYLVFFMSLDGLANHRDELPGATNGNLRVIQKDNSVPPLRFRPHVIISEQVDQNSDFARIRAVWEMNRRNGRARAVTLTTDQWRDSAGDIYAPNTLAHVDIPLLKVTNENWIVGEVTYRLDASGTHADVTMMPPGAYAPEPFVLQPVNRQVASELQGGAAKPVPSPYDAN